MTIIQTTLTTAATVALLAIGSGHAVASGVSSDPAFAPCGHPKAMSASPRYNPNTRNDAIGSVITADTPRELCQFDKYQFDSRADAINDVKGLIDQLDGNAIDLGDWVGSAKTGRTSEITQQIETVAEQRVALANSVDALMKATPATWEIAQDRFIETYWETDAEVGLLASLTRDADVRDEDGNDIGDFYERIESRQAR